MTQTENELRERKTSVLVELVKEKAGEVTRSKESLDSFLTFFSRVANRWSAPNAVAIYGQRPEIKNPVTIEQAKELGHTIKPGTKAISVLEPLAIDEKMAKKNAYLGFRKWGAVHGVTEEDLRQLCSKHVVEVLYNDLDIRSPDAALALERLIRSSPLAQTWDQEESQRLYDYSAQFLAKKGAFHPDVIRRGQNLYQWKARTSVVDLGVDTLGPKIQDEVVRDEEGVTNRRTAALLRCMEIKGLTVDYDKLNNFGPEERLRWLLYQAAGSLRNQRGQHFNLNAAVFCICSQLGIDRRFEISTHGGWGKKPGEFMANLSAIRKIQKEIVSGMDREMKTIVKLERELSRKERQAATLREILAGIGIVKPAPGSSVPNHAPGRTVQSPNNQAHASTPAIQPPLNMYFKVGRFGFLTHHEAAEFLVASRFVDAEGKELRVQIKLRDANGAKETLCEMPASTFVQEIINTQAEPTIVRAFNAALAKHEAAQTNVSAPEKVELDTLEPDSQEEEQNQETHIKYGR